LPKTLNHRAFALHLRIAAAHNRFIAAKIAAPIRSGVIPLSQGKPNCLEEMGIMSRTATTPSNDRQQNATMQGKTEQKVMDKQN